MVPPRDSVLQLHLPEDWPDAAAPNPQFRYALRRFADCDTGVAALAQIPHAATTIVVAPASAVLFVRVTLPKVRGTRLMRLLPLAVEDTIASSPEDIHVVLVDHLPGGASVVAVVGRKWLDTTLAELAKHGFEPVRLLVETELAAQPAQAGPAQPWVVVRTPAGGFACLGQGETIALDLGDEPGTLPLALRLARNTHRRQGETPAEVLVFTSPGASPTDADAWGRALEVPVRSAGDWHPERVDARGLQATDLLRGDYGTNRDAGAVKRMLKLAAIAAATVLGLHAMLTLGDWWRLKTETRQLRAQMETQFREIFPDAQAVVDAPLQMRRNLGKLRREAGMPDRSDVVPLLAAVGPVLVAVGAQAERMRYERGELELQISLPGPNEGEALARRLATPGYRVRVEPVAGDASGRLALLRVAVEA
jgi:general secretion pathway protein L